MMAIATGRALAIEAGGKRPECLDHARWEEVTAMDAETVKLKGAHGGRPAKRSPDSPCYLSGFGNHHVGTATYDPRSIDLHDSHFAERGARNGNCYFVAFRRSSRLGRPAKQ
jgi:hypothetical protein